MVGWRGVYITAINKSSCLFFRIAFLPLQSTEIKSLPQLKMQVIFYYYHFLASELLNFATKYLRPQHRSIVTIDARSEMKKKKIKYSATDNFFYISKLTDFDWIDVQNRWWHRPQIKVWLPLTAPLLIQFKIFQWKISFLCFFFVAIIILHPLLKKIHLKLCIFFPCENFMWLTSVSKKQSKHVVQVFQLASEIWRRPLNCTDYSNEMRNAVITWL